MKKIVPLSFLVLLIIESSCKEDISQEFKITGEITNDSLKIKKVILLTESNEISDTAEVNSQEFYFKGTISEPTNAGIIIEDKMYQFILVNDKIEINIGKLDKEHFKVQYQNSKVNENVQKYYSKESKYYIENYKNLEAKFVTSENNNEKLLIHSQEDSLALNFLDSIIVKYNYTDRVNELVFILNDLKGLIGTRNHPEKIEEIYTILPDTLKNGFYGKKVKRYLDQASQISLGQNIDFKFTDIKGQEHSLSDYHGRLVLLEFWASWCGPCISQIPLLRQTSARSDVIQIISVSIDDDLNKWEDKVRDLKIDWVNVHYLQKDLNLKDKFFVNEVPYNILLSQNGEILQKNISMSDLILFLKNPQFKN